MNIENVLENLHFVKKSKIFYGYSNNNGELFTFDEFLMSELENENYEINSLNDPSNEQLQFSDRMMNSISSCDAYIINMTPDTVKFKNDPGDVDHFDENNNINKNVCKSPVEKNVILINNPNTIFQFSFAEAKCKQGIILINRDKYPDYELPMILKGVKTVNYSFNKKYDVLRDVISKLDVIIANNNFCDKFVEVPNIILPKKLIDMLDLIIGINIIRYKIAINVVTRCILIFFYGTKTLYLRYIDVHERKFISVNDVKDIDLSIFKEIDDELKHIEILCNSRYFN